MSFLVAHSRFSTFCRLRSLQCQFFLYEYFELLIRSSFSTALYTRRSIFYVSLLIFSCEKIIYWICVSYHYNMSALILSCVTPMISDFVIYNLDNVDVWYICGMCWFLGHFYQWHSDLLLFTISMFFFYNKALKKTDTHNGLTV